MKTDTGTDTVTPASGVASFTKTLVGTGARTFTATSGTLTATDGKITSVTPGTATKLIITTADGSNSPVKTDVSASQPVITVTAEDAQGAVATGFAGQITLTSENGDTWAKGSAANGPLSSFTAGTTTTVQTGTYTFTGATGSTVCGGASPQLACDNGVANFKVTLDKAGKDPITATGTSLTTASTSILVTPAAASQFVVAVTTTAPKANGKTCSAASPSAGTLQCWINGEPVKVKVTAEDAAGNVATGYTGAVTLSGSDGDKVTYPGASTATSYTFVKGDAGVKTLSLQFLGCQALTSSGTKPCADTLTATDSTITATDTEYVVPGSVTQLAIAAPSSYVAKTGIVAGTQTVYTVTPENLYGQAVLGFTDKIKIGSSDQMADLPATEAYAFTGTSSNVAMTVNVTLHSVGTKAITVKDVASKSTVKAGSVAIKSTAGTADHLDIFAPDNAENGSTIKVIVAVLDSQGFPVTSGYAGSVALTSTETGDVLPSAHALSNGEYTFTVQVKGCTSGTCADAFSASDGTVHQKTTYVVHVTPGAVTQLAVVVGGSTAKVAGAATAGTAVSSTVTAENAYGQTVEDYTGTVHFISSDGLADVPANYTFTGGPDSSTTCAASSSSLPVCTDGTQTFGGTTPGEITLNTAGSQTVTVMQINHATVKGTAKVTVTAAG